MTCDRHTAPLPRRPVVAGTQLDLQVEGIDRVLRVRFIETGAEGALLQLPLNLENLTYMGQALGKLGLAAAA